MPAVAVHELDICVVRGPNAGDDEKDTSIISQWLPSIATESHPTISSEVTPPLLLCCPHGTARGGRSLNYRTPLPPYCTFMNQGMRKPDPSCYDCAVNELKVEPQDLVFVDDRLANVEAVRQPPSSAP